MAAQRTDQQLRLHAIGIGNKDIEGMRSAFGQWQKIAEEIEAAYFEILGKKLTVAYEKKASSAPSIAGEDLPLHRRAG